MREKISLLVTGMVFSIFLFLAFQLGKSEKPNFTYESAFELANGSKNSSETSLDDNNDSILKKSYVPAYSHIYASKNNAIEMAITLSLRNTDNTTNVQILSVLYYNTEGKLIRKYINDGYTLKPLETKEIFIESSDLVGGSGANFLIEFKAKETTSEPIFESIMVSEKDPGKSHTFISRGKNIL